ncbi:MAG TPA: hypothetical protein VNV43_08855 [Candidatus Acidoferrales bacterium]|jgi:hypothetical protein|nr:hypothetical protein [Candidatus Acidoferrales bacterium]
MKNKPFKNPFIEALVGLRDGMIAVPDKLGPLRMELEAAHEKVLQASAGLMFLGTKPFGPEKAKAEIEAFQAAIRSVRLACYGHIRHYNDLIALMDSAIREVSEVVKKCEGDDHGH